jgi:hypothetical protein
MKRERENDDGTRKNYSFDLVQAFSRDGGEGERENCISVDKCQNNSIRHSK